MWQIYEIESYLDPVVACVRDTLENHCKKGKRIEHSIGETTFWFKVSKNKRRDGDGFVIKAEGKLGKCNFIFRSGGRTDSFSSDYYTDAENTFRQFILMVNFLRKTLGLEPLDLDELYDIVEEDSPPVSADNYAFFIGSNLRAFRDILRRKFTGAAHREFAGKYSIIVYSKNARATKYFCEKNTPVYRKFLEAFVAFYGFEDVIFVCARRGREQHIYFYVKGKGVFCNTEDSSRAFLEEEHETLTEILSITLGGVDKDGSEMLPTLWDGKGIS